MHRFGAVGTPSKVVTSQTWDLSRGSISTYMVLGTTIHSYGRLEVTQYPPPFSELSAVTQRLEGGVSAGGLPFSKFLMHHLSTQLLH